MRLIRNARKRAPGVAPVRAASALLLLALVLAACAPAPAAAPTTKPAVPTPAAAQTAAPAATSAPATTPAAAKGKPVSLGMIVKNLVNPYFVNMQRGAEAAAKSLDAQIRVLAPSKPDNVEEQIQLMENLVQSKVDAIVLVPADSRAIVPAVNGAKSANIPVFTADTRVIGTDVMTFVGVDNVTIARQVTQYVVDWAKKEKGGSAGIIVLEGVPGASSTVDRLQGVNEVLKANPSISVLASQTANYNRVQATSVTENLLTRFPNADLVLALNDEMALGAIEAIKARGKTPGRDIQVVGINAAANALDAMEKGELAATVYANEYCMAYQAVQAAVAYLRDGKKPDPEVLSGSSVLVTKDNLTQFKKLRDEQAAGATCR